MVFEVMEMRKVVGEVDLVGMWCVGGVGVVG